MGSHLKLNMLRCRPLALSRSSPRRSAELSPIEGPWRLAFAGLGLVIPATMVLALEDHGPIAGMASALAGTLQMLTGAAIIFVVSVFFDGTALPMVATIALCALVAFTLSGLTLHAGKMVANPAE